jgi:hypothetical protein
MPAKNSSNLGFENEGKTLETTKKTMNKDQVTDKNSMLAKDSKSKHDSKVLTPKLKVKPRFVIYTGANFIQSIIKKLDEIRLSLLLTSNITKLEKEVVQSKLDDITEILDENN